MQCTIQHLHWKVDYLPQRIVGRPAVVADLFRNCDDGGDDDDVEGAEVEARWIGRRDSIARCRCGSYLFRLLSFGLISPLLTVRGACTSCTEGLHLSLK